MDLERIKKNLRLRSGRTKVTQRGSRAQTPDSVQILNRSSKENWIDTASPRHANPTGALTALPSLEAPRPSHNSTVSDQKRKRVNVQQGQGQVVEPQRKQIQSEQYTANGDARKGLPRRKSTRYGRSGIEITTTSFSPEASPVGETLEANRLSHARSEEVLNFDLISPSQTRSKNKSPVIEGQSELLFSGDHLNTILHDQRLLSRFTAFLNKYLPQQVPLLTQYLETQKAVKAVAYANAVFDGLPPLPNIDVGDDSNAPKMAASLDPAFEAFCSSAFQKMVRNLLPLFLTYSLVRNVSDLLVTAITGTATPLIRELVDGLSEVFCLTDPNQEDNPIIYASEEFYRLTRYGSSDVLGYNCRFLQGPRTNKDVVRRLAAAIQKGEETCETLLNYRRDGRPFINLLMIAPLHDDKGNVKYFLGAQVDVSSMVEGGRGLESFHQCLAEKRGEDIVDEENQAEDSKRSKALARLRDLSEMFDLEESAVVQAGSRPGSANPDADGRTSAGVERPKSARRTFAESDHSDDDDDEEEKATPGDKAAWRLSQPGYRGLSGKLPGVYENFMLIRPAPSLRIVFVSPKLHKIGKIAQSPFMSHVAANEGTLRGLRTSLTDGTPVTAKIHFMPQRGDDRYGTKIPSSAKQHQSSYGRASWISCTPLRGVDGGIGVWMVVFVEETAARIALQRAPSPEAMFERVPSPRKSTVQQQERQSSGSAERQPAPKMDHQSYHEETESERDLGRGNGTHSGANSSLVPTPIMPSFALPRTGVAPADEYNEIRRDYQHVPSSVSPPLPAQSSDIDDNAVTSEEEFVQTRPRRPSPSPNERVIIQPDNEEGQELVATDESPASLHQQGLEGAHSSYSGGHAQESPRSIPSDAQFDQGSEVAEVDSPGDVKQQADKDSSPMVDEHYFHGARQVPSYVLEAPPDTKNESSSEVPESPSPQLSRRRTTSSSGRTQTQRYLNRPVSQSSNYKSTGMRLEYVTLPHSRQSTESKRGMTGSWQVKSKPESDEDRITEDECARSPYSVD